MMNNVRDMDPAFRAASSYSGVGVDTAAAGALDNSYYTANLQNMVLLKSDWELTQDEDTLARLVAYRDDAARWNKDFGEAMERLSSLRPPVGARLEIRKTCRLTNLSPGRAVVHALKSFLRRRYDQISGLLKYFNAGLM
jgi:peroxidase